MKFPIVLLLSTILIQGGSSFSVSLDGVLDLFIHGKDLAVSILKAWDVINDVEEFNDHVLPLKTRERRVMDRLNYVVQKLQTMSDKYDEVGAQAMQSMIRNLPKAIKLELKLNDLTNAVDDIDVKYMFMKNYINSSNFQVSTLADFSNSILSHEGNSVVNLIEKIFKYFVPNKEGSQLLDSSLLNGLVDNLKVKNFFFP